LLVKNTIILFLICSIKIEIIILIIKIYFPELYYLNFSYQFNPFSYLNFFPLLSCVLIITNEINKNNDHSEYDKEKDILDPWFITGFSDGDSSFWFILVPNKKLKIGFELKPGFSLIAAINPANYDLILKIDIFFKGIGSIIKYNKTKMYEYRVQGLKFFKKHFYLIL